MNMHRKTHNYESALADYCRTGDMRVIQKVNTQTVHHYRRLVRNNIDTSISTVFPLTKNLLTEKEWDEMIDCFIQRHDFKTPQIWKMPAELINFLSVSKYALLTKYPFLTELLQFEWLELEVYMMEDQATPEYTPYGDVHFNDLILNPEIRLASFTYPVHLKNAKEITDKDKNQYFVSVHRHPDTGHVHFTNLSLPHAQLLYNLSNGPVKYSNIVQLFTAYLPENQVEEVINDFLVQVLRTKLILGYSHLNKN